LAEQFQVKSFYSPLLIVGYIFSILVNAHVQYGAYTSLRFSVGSH
jgi:hypothetical protein